MTKIHRPVVLDGQHQGSLMVTCECLAFQPDDHNEQQCESRKWPWRDMDQCLANPPDAENHLLQLFFRDNSSVTLALESRDQLDQAQDEIQVQLVVGARHLHDAASETGHESSSSHCKSKRPFETINHHTSDELIMHPVEHASPEEPPLVAATPMPSPDPELPLEITIPMTATSPQHQRTNESNPSHVRASRQQTATDGAAAACSGGVAGVATIACLCGGCCCILIVVLLLVAAATSSSGAVDEDELTTTGGIYYDDYYGPTNHSSSYADEFWNPDR